MNVASAGRRVRLAFELALRVGSFVVLAWMVGLGSREWRVGSREWAVMGGDEFDGQLMRWTVMPTAESLHVTLNEPPAPVWRDWLRALRRNGPVSWSGQFAAVAMEVYDAGGPSNDVRVLAAAPPGAVVELSDDVGPIDTAVVAPAESGVSFRIPFLVGAVRIAARNHGASAAPRDSVGTRRVLVLGSAGWESKFAVAALEERGWDVDARIQIAPGIFVTQGSPAQLDTSVHGAVIVLDRSAARDASRITTFVLSGGGAIIGPDAVRSGAFGAIAPGRAAEQVGSSAVQPVAASLATLTLSPIRSLRAGSVALASRQNQVSTAARRVGAGRVAQIGYNDTWQWRMAGGEQSPEAHREWWSSLVVGVAYRPTHTLQAHPHLDAAPLANLITALGKPRTTVSVATTRDGLVARQLRPWMFALLAVLLLTEWASRRLRGAP
ncbi:MAG: hypothetical protein ABR543_02045 [Gemmatimonadaceae bacterium]